MQVVAVAIIAYVIIVVIIVVCEGGGGQLAPANHTVAAIAHARPQPCL